MEQKTAFPVFSTKEQAVDITSLPTRKEPSEILVCEPTFFDVIDAKNPFMNANIGSIDKKLALNQWNNLKEIYESLGTRVRVIPAGNELEDMVFTANQVLPFINEEERKSVLLSKMRHSARQKEITHFEQWFKNYNYEIYKLPLDESSTLCFEGQGDAIWHTDRKLLWGGFGSRTDESVYDLISSIISAPVAKLRLTTSNFYHLDTCFCILSSDSVMIYPEAFDQAGLALIKHYFKTVIEVSKPDAMNFVCNSAVIGQHIIMQKGSLQTRKQLEELGYQCIEVDTSEFMKSGGSVFCMKMMIY